MFDDIVKRKQAFLDYKNKEFKNVKKLEFSPWFWSKSEKFSSFAF